MGQNGAVVGQVPHFGHFPYKKSAKEVPKRVENQVLFRLHREMHRALSLLPRKTQQLRDTRETGEN